MTTLREQVPDIVKNRTISSPAILIEHARLVVKAYVADDQHAYREELTRLVQEADLLRVSVTVKPRGVRQRQRIAAERSRLSGQCT